MKKQHGIPQRRPLKVNRETIRVLETDVLKTVDGAVVVESADCTAGSHSGCPTGCRATP
jgi:hypothetical protein